MNAETVERLLIDRSLGMLPKDVETLLDAHLAIDDDAAKQAAEFGQTTALARRALTSETAAELPPFPAEQLRREGRSLQRWIWARNISAVAATLVLGFGLGAALFRNPAGVAPSGTGAVVEPVLVAGALKAPPSASGIWSARRMIERASRAPSEKPARLIWESPVRKPRLGDA